MLEGKVKQALKLVDSSNDITGVHTMTADVKQKLKEKHPEEGELHADALSAEDIGQCEDVIFEEIDGEMVQQVVKGMSGSGGPSLVDVETVSYTHLTLPTIA